MLKKIVLGILFLALFWVILSHCGCGYPPQIIISQPPMPGVVVVQSELPVIVSADSAGTTLDSLNAAPSIREVILKPWQEYRPDPCKGLVKNYSSGLVIWVWLNKTSGPNAEIEPDFKLLPQQAMTVYAPVGPLKVYAEASQKTAYGWRKVGAYAQEQRVSPYAYNAGDFNWRVYLSDWNFPGMQ